MPVSTESANSHESLSVSWHPRIVPLQLALFAAWFALLISPFGIPDPLGLQLPLAWTAVSLLAVTLIWLPDLATGRWPRTAIDPILAACIGIVVITSLTGVNRQQSLITLLSLAGNISLFYVVVNLARKAEWMGEGIVLALVGALAVILLAALAFHAELGLSQRPKEYPVPPGWSGYPELGTLAAMQFAMLLAGLLTTQRASGTVAVAMLSMVNLFELAYLYSRGSWVAVAAVLPFAGALMISRGHARRLLLIGAAGVVVVAILVAANPTLRYLVRNLTQGVDAVQPPGLGLEVPATPDMRLAIWGRALRLIGDHPVTGVGPGNFQEVFETVYNPEIARDGRRGVHAHNLWLQQFAETGVIGGLVYVWLWAAVGWSAWRLAKHRPGFVTYALFLSIVAMAASNMVTNIFFLTGGAAGRLHSLTWVLFGLVMAASSNHGLHGEKRITRRSAIS